MSLLESVRVVKTPNPPVEDDNVFPADYQPSAEDWAALRDESDCDLSGPVAGVLSFPDWIDAQASYYRSLGSNAGDWMARQIEGLAQLARWTGAADPATHDERMLVHEEQLRERHYQMGYADAMGSQN